MFYDIFFHYPDCQPRWLSGLMRSRVHSLWLLVDHCVLRNWDRILVRAVKGLISRAGMVSICPLLWQRDVKLKQTNNPLSRLNKSYESYFKDNECCESNKMMYDACINCYLWFATMNDIIKDIITRLLQCTDWDESFNSSRSLPVRIYTDRGISLIITSGGCTSALVLVTCIPRVDITTISIVLFMYANEVGANRALHNLALPCQPARKWDGS